MYNIILTDKSILSPQHTYVIKNVLPYEFEDKAKAKETCDIFNKNYQYDEQMYTVVEVQTLANLLRHQRNMLDISKSDKSLQDYFYFKN